VLPQADIAALCKLLRGGNIDVLTFTSSSTATNFAALLHGQDLPSLLSRVVIACIGPITKKTVEDLGMQPKIVSEEFTIPGLVGAIVDYFSSNSGERTAGRN
jgi:uroporphyrinogen III methyltransferase/synthase